MKRLVFLGPPGAGKGTQAQVLAQQVQIPHISTGEILREAIAQGTPLGEKAQSYVSQGELVPDDLLLGLIRERLQASDAELGWILDGFPRNVSQASFLNELLEKDFQQTYDAVYIEVPDEILINRLLARGRSDDHEEIIRRRLQVYREQTEPVIGFYRDHGNLHSINGNGYPEEVAKVLTAIVQS